MENHPRTVVTFYGDIIIETCRLKCLYTYEDREVEHKDSRPSDIHTFFVVDKDTPEETLEFLKSCKEKEEDGWIRLEKEGYFAAYVGHKPKEHPTRIYLSGRYCSITYKKPNMSFPLAWWRTYEKDRGIPLILSKLINSIEYEKGTKTLLSDIMKSWNIAEMQQGEFRNDLQKILKVIDHKFVMEGKKGQSKLANAKIVV